MLYPYRDPDTGKFARAVVRNMPKTNAIEFINDSVDVAALSFDLGISPEDYDSFFVVVGDGDYIAVWGMCGIVPYLTKPLQRLV